MTTTPASAIALDLGSTSIKAGLLDPGGQLRNIVASPAPPVSVDGDRCESDALAYAVIADQVLHDCHAQTGGLPHFGMCSQRSSFLIWERASGQPLTPLISWQDHRGASSCAALHAQENLIRELTGLRLTPYFFAPKLQVLLQEHLEWRAKLESGELLAGTLDTFLIWRWTAGVHHVTDVSMAARTLLLDIQQRQWSPRLCDLFDIPMGILPRILPSAGINLRLDNQLTLQSSLGDQSAALYASVGDRYADVLINLGTGGFAIRNLPQAIAAPDGYLRTLILQDSQLRFHLGCEGTLNSIAAALAPYSLAECRSEELASVDVFCIAEPSGIGAPYFRTEFGLHFSGPVDHLPPRLIATLLLEGIIFRIARILEDFNRASAIERAYLSGGLSEVSCLQQGLALCVPFDVYRLQQRESSLQGAALLASGMSPNASNLAEKITVLHHIPALVQKYQRWKKWFDALLNHNNNPT
ncbi:MAG: FGGY family carbohydrate kinase [Pseudomonadota bacterium]